jgi:hypothetical protein
MTPLHRESDIVVKRGSITKQGSKLVRWAAIEAISRGRGGSFLQSQFHQLAERRDNRNVARVATARKLLTLVFYGLRDGEVRCLARHAA